LLSEGYNVLFRVALGKGIAFYLELLSEGYNVLSRVTLGKGTAFLSRVALCKELRTEKLSATFDMLERFTGLLSIMFLQNFN
jgi:hypothetical protein